MSIPTAKVHTECFAALSRPLAIAHRGGALRWPENTLVAFRGALAHSIRAVETDLHVTRDGQLVIIHDPTLDRTTNGRGRVEDHGLGALRRLDAGFHFADGNGAHPFRDRGVTLPTYEELLALDPGLHVVTEIKTTHRKVADLVWSEIRNANAESRVLVASEHDAVLESFRRLSRGRVCTSAGRKAILRFWLSCRVGLSALCPLRCDALQVPAYHEGKTVIDRRFVECAMKRGIEVHAWTINDRVETQRLLSLGVRGIISDDPDLLRTLVGSS